MSHYPQASFLTSAHQPKQFIADEGAEVAFAGRSNAGKSSAINTIVNQRNFARTSKSPGRTQLINFFQLRDQQRLVDLPGYGYAKVPHSVQNHWRKLMGAYFEQRQSLAGLIVVVDIRRSLGDYDWQMIDWANEQSNGDMKMKYWCLYVQILQLSPKEATEFSVIYDRHHDRSYSWPMAEACDILLDGASPDSFDDFRAALLSMGQQVYERAIDDPDSLAEVDASIETWRFESYSYAVMKAVNQVTGGYAERLIPAPEELSDKPWQSLMVERFPKLVKWSRGRRSAHR